MPFHKTSKQEWRPQARFRGRWPPWAQTLSLYAGTQAMIQVISFLTGIVIVRNLAKEDYAYYTIANTVQGSMILLADTGVGTGVLAVGGRVWQDRVRMGQLITTALRLRRTVALIVVSCAAPIMLWQLTHNGAGLPYALLLFTLVVLGLYFHLTIGVVGIVPRLHGRLDRVQTFEMMAVTLRLVLILGASLLFLNAAAAMATAVLSFALLSSLYWRAAADLIDRQAPANAEDAATLRRLVVGQAANVVFYCLQGQITIWLIASFGDAESVAEVGAVGRLGVIFSLIGAIMTNVMGPRFARWQDRDLLKRRYVQMVLALASALFGIFVLTLFLSKQILWVLGSKYAHLEDALTLLMAGALLSTLGTGLWTLNMARAWVDFLWLFIPSTLLTQVVSLRFLDVGSVHGVLLFGVISTIPWLLLNLLMTYRGFRSSQWPDHG